VSLEKYMETLIHFASSGSYEQELMAARQDFFSQFGQVSEEEDGYEEKLRRFLDWYIFDRPSTETGMPPVRTFYDKFVRTFNESDGQVYQGFCETVHSLFIVKKCSDTGVTIQDMITRRKFFVEDDVPRGFTKDEVFQGRLIPFQEGYRFGESFCFHPLSANKAIKKLLKRVDLDQPDAVREFLADLLVRRQNSERYRHVDALRFYEEKD
jgi:hypothetical protein